MSEDHDVLFLPGPVEVDPELRAILAMPAIGHRSQRCKAEIEKVCAALQGLFRTRSAALFENCPATALMEASIRNLVTERVLHLTCGAFSERWHLISQSCGRSADAVAAPWGVANDVASLERALRENGPYDAVAITHNETSTGVLNPLEDLCATVRRVAPQTLILVDVVTSLAGCDVRFDDWGIDVAFAGTQKCLALPPGLTVYAVSERALAKAATIERRGWLLDFVRASQGLAKAETVATPSVPLIFALSRQLERIAAEGLERRFARHEAMQRQTAEWANAHGFTFFPAEPAARSRTVSCLNASGHDVDELANRARAARFVIDRGYGALKGKTFRIGHMGDHDEARLARLLASMA
jgi:aspartate aminotransferase-like enzyme